MSWNRSFGALVMATVLLVAAPGVVAAGGGQDYAQSVSSYEQVTTDDDFDSNETSNRTEARERGEKQRTPTPPEGTEMPDGRSAGASVVGDLGLSVHTHMDDDGIVVDVREEGNGTVTLDVTAVEGSYAGSGSWTVDGSQHVELPRPDGAKTLRIAVENDRVSFQRTITFEYRTFDCGLSGGGGLPSLDRVAAQRHLVPTEYGYSYEVQMGNRTTSDSRTVDVPAPDFEDCPTDVENLLDDSGRPSFADDREESVAAAAVWANVSEKRNGTIGGGAVGNASVAAVVGDRGGSVFDARDDNDGDERSTPPKDGEVTTPPEMDELTPPEEQRDTTPEFEDDESDDGIGGEAELTASVNVTVDDGASGDAGVGGNVTVGGDGDA